MRRIEPVVGKWRKPYLSGHFEQRIFGVKVGHIYQRDVGDWVALFDGNVLGTYRTSAEARACVDVIGSEVC